MGVLADKRRARVFYKYLSAVYDLINPLLWTADMRAEALDMLDLDRDARVLDVGCGTGFGTEGLLQFTDDVHALDQSVHQLEQAWKKLGKRGPVSFYLGDAERLPFEEDSFDAVWSSGSIEYWPNPVETLADLRRVTRSGGRVLVVGPNTPTTPPLARLADKIMLTYDRVDADKMFHAAGFERVEHRLVGPSYAPRLAIVTRATVSE